MSRVRPTPPKPPPPAPVPDRELAAAANLPTMIVSATGYRPFVYRKMVDGPQGAANPNLGDIVRVIDREGAHIGFALWNGRSRLALRFLSRAAEPPDDAFWAGRIDRAANLREGLLQLGEATNAYRLIHAEADGMPGLVVDRFDDVLSVEVSSLGMYQRIGPILDLCASRLGTRHFRVGVDERVAEQEDFAGRPLASPNLPPRVTIHEHGVRYRVHFEGSHKTGFFCDQRDNRYNLAKYCQDRTVLDACSYTGGFGLNALIRGKAREATCVDLDEKAIAIARENANANNVRPTLVHADAFGYLRQMGINERKYGVVALDPPKLIPNKDEVPGGKRKYFDLNVLAMKLVERGGLLLTCSCSGLLPPSEFIGILRAAADKAGRAARLLALTGAAPDHPVALEAPEGAYLKAAWLLIDEER